MKNELIDIVITQDNNKELSNSDILYGTTRISPIQQLKVISPDEYEEITGEWALGYGIKKYIEVKQFGGRGDKGRDICGIIKHSNGSYIYDLYQCKRYDKQLSYNSGRYELGKLLYYTYKNIYPIPRNYYFMCPEGVQCDFYDLFTCNHKSLKDKIIQDWTSIAKQITTSKKIKLTSNLKEYILKFDYSIIRDVSPHDFIDQYRQTPYYAKRFGGGLQKRRNIENINIPEKINPKETVYVRQLFEAYSDVSEKVYEKQSDLEKMIIFKDHFNRSRNSFYLVETLKQFNRDNLPNDTAFYSLMDEVFEQVIDVCLTKHENGFERLKATTNMAKKSDYLSNPLSYEIRTADKTGICHHLANEEKLIWVQK